MINNYGPINSSYVLPQTNNQPQTNGASSNADILSSFQEMFSLMMLSNSMSTDESQSSTGISDFMAPIMMLLLEKLIEQQLDTSALSTENVQEQESKAAPSGRPVGGYLSQAFHPGHNGLDFGIVVGTPVQSTMDGKVIHAGWNNEGYGNLVIVENGAYRTYYAHLSSIPVSIGDTVNAGATIGLSGNTGNSTGPHLHYEIRENKVPIDPTLATLGASA